MKKIIFIGVLATLLLFVWIPTALADMAEIMKAAEKEGEVLWTSTFKDNEAAPFIEAFQKAYPKIKVTHEREHGGEAMERLLREISSGAPVKDLVQIHGDYENMFMKMDAVQSVNWADFKVEPAIVSRDNRLVGLSGFYYAFVFNTNLVKKEEAPKTWNDLLDPKWKGKLVCDTRPNAFMYLTGAWEPKKVLDYAQKLGKQNLIFVRGQTQTMNLMAAGDYMISATAYLHPAVELAEKGAPLAWMIPDPVPFDYAKLGILKGAKHPNAAKVFLGWLGSSGYELMDQINWGRSVPIGKTKMAKEIKGKTLSEPPSEERLPDRQGFQNEINKLLGVKKSKVKSKK